MGYLMQVGYRLMVQPGPPRWGVEALDSSTSLIDNTRRRGFQETFFEVPIMRRTGLVVLWLIVMASVCEGAQLWVAPEGNDLWSGQFREPNAAKTDGPFATIARAQDAVRQLRRVGTRHDPVRVGIVGRVSLDRPWVITPGESGTAESPTVYHGYPEPGCTILSGGRPITGWKKGPGVLWTAEIPEVQAGTWYFRQLFVNGRRAQRARSPQTGYHSAAGLAPQDGKGKWNEGVDRFTFHSGDLRAWNNLDQAEVVLFHSWNTSRLRIRSVDEANCLVTFTGPSVFRPFGWDPKQRYYVENARELLDSPGEWYLDRKSGTLTYWPLPDEDLTKAEVVAPVLTELVRFEGDPDAEQFVDYVELEGLSLHHTDWSLADCGYGDPQAAVTVPAMVSARGARHCRIRQCEIAHVGNYGLWFSRGCKNNEIEDNHLYDLGAGGIRLGEPKMPPNDVTESTENRVAGNYIHDGGIVYPAGVGLWIAQSSRNVICHNEIHSLNYTGISVGWNWNEVPTRTLHNRIEYNHVHHVVRGMLSDGAGIYTLGTQTGTVIRNNVFHDIFPYMGRPTMAWGIYFDQGSNGLLVENNIVYNTLTGGLMNTGLSGNVVRNNVFAMSGWQAVWRFKFEHDPPTRVERNIFYWTQGDLFHDDPGRDDTHSVWDHNLYWQSKGQPVTFYDEDFAAWQAKGLDRHGRVADPRFVAPEKYDFRLQPDSPAMALGFVPIDTSLCGLRPAKAGSRWDLAALARQAQFPATQLPPPSPSVTVDDDFESTPVGEKPSQPVVLEEGPADSIRVTDETACAGKRSLKVTDAPKLKHIFNPHLYWAPHWRAGRAVFGLDVRIEPRAKVAIEWRDNHQPYRVGPSLAIDSQGRLLASGRPLAEVPLSKWFHLEIECALGSQANGQYDVVLSVPGTEPQRFTGLACGAKDFSRLDWLGIISLANEKTVFYLDNVKCSCGTTGTDAPRAQ